MEEENNNLDKRFIDIPNIFYSFETKEEFNKCKVCDLELIESGTEYFIEKAYKRFRDFSAQDVIFEYAICSKCTEMMKDSFSHESAMALQNYFITSLSDEKKYELMIPPSDPDVDARLSNCLIKDTPIAEVEEYQIVGQLIGGKMLFGMMPYLVSGLVLDEISNLISNKTLDELDNFKRKVTAPPPELEDILKDRKIVFL